MSNDPFRTSAAPPQEKPTIVHPYGYGSWRCQKCGAWDKTTRVGSRTNDAWLLCYCLTCRSTWFTRTLEAERQFKRDTGRPEKAYPLWAAIPLAVCGVLTGWTLLLDEEGLRMAVGFVALLCFAAWWGNR